MLLTKTVDVRKMNTGAAFTFLTALLVVGSAVRASPPDAKEPAEDLSVVDAEFMKGSEAILDGDYKTAFDLLSRGATKRHAPSQAALGFLHFNGWGCEKDLQKARRLYEESAEAGAHQGLNNLAHLYRYGLAGLDKDLPTAVKLLERSAKLGHEKAAYTLAVLYRSDELGPADLAKSIEWLEFGADRSNPACLSDLGFAYQHGIGVQEDIKKAADLFQKGVDAGSAQAAANLGYLYLQGEGMDQDYSKALELFEASTKADNVAGHINLALMRFRGLGCERDPKAAFSLLERASDQGSEQAKQLLKEWKAKEANPHK